jgi:hypothetical protein
MWNWRRRINLSSGFGNDNIGGQSLLSTKTFPIRGIRTQNEQIEDRSKGERTFASLTSGFGLLALVLACIGIYGLRWPTASLGAPMRSAFEWRWERNQAGYSA